MIFEQRPDLRGGASKPWGREFQQALDLLGDQEEEQMGLNRLLCRGKPWNCMDIGWGPDHTTGKHGRVRVRIMARMERERRVKIGMI